MATEIAKVSKVTAVTSGTSSVFMIIISAVIFYLIAFATEGWAEYGRYKVGLWKVCSCGSEADLQKESWFIASQAMFSMGFLSMFVSVILAGLFMILHISNKNTLIILMITACFSTVLLQLIGLLVFAIEMYDNRYYQLSWSYALAAISCILCFCGGVVSICQIRNSKRVIIE